MPPPKPSPAVPPNTWSCVNLQPAMVRLAPASLRMPPPTPDVAESPIATSFDSEHWLMVRLPALSMPPPWSARPSAMVNPLSDAATPLLTAGRIAVDGQLVSTKAGNRQVFRDVQFAARERDCLPSESGTENDRVARRSSGDLSTERSGPNVGIGGNCQCAQDRAILQPFK